MKKGFTLLEIIITLGLIAIVLSMVTNMGQGFSDKVRFSNTKEEVSATIINVIQDAATTNVLGRGTGAQKYDFITVEIASGNKVIRTYASGEITTPVVFEKEINRGTLTTSGFGLVLRPYTVGCDTNAGGSFTVSSNDNPSYKACFATDAPTCKLREVPCNP